MNSSGAKHPVRLRRQRWLAAALTLATTIGATGCIGYSRSAKRWAYVGNSTLLASGAGALTLGILTYDTSCPTTTGGSSSTNSCVTQVGPVSGISVVGAMLLVGGIVGIVLTATRPLPRNAQR
ncbi:MAG TPA: hypothetical protein PLF40_13490 [Kofleriaceae bacterium]|nr:hypothetical protein [Kofleriaceae bacterium]